MRRSAGSLILAAAFLLGARVGMGQAALGGEREGSIEAKRAAAVSILIQIAGPSDMSTGPYADSLAAALMRSDAILSVSRASGLGDERLVERARRDACSLILRVELAESGADLAVRWTVHIVGSAEAPAEGAVVKSRPSEDELASAFWVETVDAAAAAAASLRPARLAITGLPGTVVEGFGDPILLPKSGSVVIPLALPSRIPWVASAPGRIPERGVFLASADGQRLAIPRRRWALDVGAYGLAFGELRASYSPSGRFFARASLSQFFFGLSLADSHNDSQPQLVLSYPLVQAGLGLGFYSAPQIAELRSYLSLDLFARLFFPEGRGIYLDPVAPVGAQPSVGLEWGRGPVVRLYAEIGAVFYPWAMPGLMAASLDGNSASGLIFGGKGWISGQPGWFLEVPVARIGARFRL